MRRKGTSNVKLKSVRRRCFNWVIRLNSSAGKRKWKPPKKEKKAPSKKRKMQEDEDEEEDNDYGNIADTEALALSLLSK